jgi:hypothetical protein
MRTHSVSSWYTTVVAGSTAADRSARGTLRQACLRVAVFGVLLGLAASSGWAATEPAKKPTAKNQETVVSKTITGEVVWVGKRAISVEYDRTAESSYEMLVPVGGDTKVERIKSLSDLKRGDVVSVQYKQRSKKAEDGKDVVLGTMASHVALIRQASPDGALRSNRDTSLE